MSLKKAIQKTDNKTTTTNGMKAKKSTLSSLVDLFFAAGASRGRILTSMFANALDENEEVAVRLALWLRDVREGAGERQHFRDFIEAMATWNYKLAIRLLPKIPELGRWDDLLSLVGTPVEKEAFTLISEALRDGNGLCAKWMPRKGQVAAKLRKHMGLTPKEYRKTLVGLTNVVETLMCNKEWNTIDFSKLPSLASARYQKAFGRNAPEKYNEYINSLVKGETKINASAVYPYDIVKSVLFGESRVANEQWKALPNWVSTEENILPVIDTSGSMCCAVGGNKNLRCIDVAIGLGIYLAERLKGDFKDHYISFSSRPELISLNGTLKNKVDATYRGPWGMNTNLEATFDLILKSAIKSRLKQEELPTTVVIFSDMQFDYCVQGKSAFGMIKEKYKKAGYTMPKLVFWNLNHYDNFPVKKDKSGVALVSGFSPSLMKTIFSAEEFNPEAIMLETLMKDRYNY